VGLRAGLDTEARGKVINYTKIYVDLLSVGDKTQLSRKLGGGGVFRDRALKRIGESERGRIRERGN
jgi:hypothetical protein